MASRPWRVAGFIAKYVLRAIWISTMILTPLFGFWLASSLAAYENASQWVSLLIGLALFPLIPLGWDFFYLWRRSRQAVPRKHILTRIDRLVLRTLLVNGLFLGVMMWRAPQVAFRALAVRGDWILDGYNGPIASKVRGVLLGFADHFEQRWHKSDGDTYGTSDIPPPDIVATEQPFPGWPMSTAPEMQVTNMPEQPSVEAVGQYLAARITDKKRLVKALHDHVVLRLTYDTPTSELRGEDRYTKRPSQQAEDVWRARTGVCEGYARLMVALGKAAGVEIAYITGYIRDTERDVDPAATDDVVKATLEGYGHAWNAVKIDGTWHLLDATWDDTSDSTTEVSTTYLLTPPKLFRHDHLPEEAAWQLVAVPLTAGEFARQPLLSPSVGRLGVVLEAPTRSQITVTGGEAQILLDNPFGATVTAHATHAGSKEREVRCTVETTIGTRIAIKCELGHGQYEIKMFGSPAGSTGLSYDYFGTILVNSR
ncbi:MAG: hypothetical protein H0T46_07500 [Deltaproteobacteria bacterium]|nr:hypothetical protein [Deltaproteobacteria bacterium]